MNNHCNNQTTRLRQQTWLAITAIVMFFAAATACTNSNPEVEESITDATLAIADGDWNHAQASCDHLLTIVTGPDSALVTEHQAARLGILFMKLSEQQREYDNVADAIECLRHAYRMSDDSLSEFSASLPPEDERHFVLLRRIGISIDHPVDLSEKDSSYDGSDSGDNDTCISSQPTQNNR